MTRARTSVRVTILGEEYTLRTHASPEETHAVAKQVDSAIREIMQAGVVESHKAAILACLRLAGELMQTREEQAALSDGMTALSQEIRPWLPPAKRYD
ncbi:MAG TPA: cell division protein ZapA [Candidatus Elarobacter sp.]|nr:cell division protein ZapA [Candidatus Elarobacter sp.]